MVKVGHVWFTAQRTVGIVLVMTNDETTIKAYIAAVGGLDEEDDIQYIREWGAKFPVLEAANLIRKHGERTCSDEVWLKVINLALDKNVQKTDAESTKSAQ